MSVIWQYIYDMRKAGKLSGPLECETVVGESSLKGVLMRLGNRLVTERGKTPAFAAIRSDVAKTAREKNSLDVLTAFIEWLNLDRDAQEILAELGYEWPTTPQQQKEAAKHE